MSYLCSSTYHVAALLSLLHAAHLQMTNYSPVGLFFHSAAQKRSGWSLHIYRVKQENFSLQKYIEESCHKNLSVGLLQKAVFKGRYMSHEFSPPVGWPAPDSLPINRIPINSEDDRRNSPRCRKVPSSASGGGNDGTHPPRPLVQRHAQKLPELGR